MCPKRECSAVLRFCPLARARGERRGAALSEPGPPSQAPRAPRATPRLVLSRALSHARAHFAPSAFRSWPGSWSRALGPWKSTIRGVLA